MAVNITATRSSTLFNDQDGDGLFDPGDVILTRIRITNSGGDPATGISVTDTLSGVTLVAGSVKITPIAYDDAFSLTGNTPITINAGQGLLSNDIDPDGAGGNLGLTVTSVDTTGTQGTVAFNANGSFTFTPTTGFVGITSFKYYVQDAQGLGNVTEGIVTMTVTDKVWYVDNTYGGENGASDGSYLKPFTTLTPLNNNGADADGAGDTIFVYHNGGDYTAGITLEAGQKLLGDGVGLFVNGHNIGGTERTGGVDNVTTNAVISQNSGTVLTLSTDNTVRGLTLDSNGAAVVGMADGNGSVTTAAGTLTVNNVSFTGTGQAIDIDQGGNLAVTVDSLTSSGSTAQGIQLAGTSAIGTGLITGNVTVTGGTIGGATGVLIGAAGGATTNSGGNVNFTYGGVINGTTGTAVEIQDRTGGTATFNGNITHSGTTGSGIAIDSLGHGTVNFNGQSTSITTTSGVAVNLTNSNGTINFTPAAGGNGLDVVTGSGKGIVFTGGGTLRIDDTGGANSVSTATGQILSIANGATTEMTFGSLQSTGATAGNAIDIDNLDGGTFTTGGITIANTSAGSDAINIRGGSTTNFVLNGNTDINGTGSNGDGVELNGANGTVTVANLTVDGVTGTGQGLSIVNATNTVTVTGGAIGNGTNTGDAVNITGGNSNVVIGATVSKNSGGNVVEVNGHTGGNIDFTGAITASGTASGINLVNNSGGTIDFTSADIDLTTTSNTALNFTNTNSTGAAVTFTGGDLNITTTTGSGINAQATHANAASSPIGSLTITGASNEVTVGNAQAVRIDGVSQDVTLLKVSAGSGTAVGASTGTSIFLQNAGTAVGNKFVITGTGTVEDSGGTINHSSAAATNGDNAVGTGIFLNNVGNIALANMNFVGTFGNFGIRGQGVNNFTLSDSDFSNNNAAAGPNRPSFGTDGSFNEDTIRFGTSGSTTGLKGTAVFEGNNIQGGKEVGLSVYVFGSDQLVLTIRDKVGGDQAIFGENHGGTAPNYNDGTGTDAFLLESGGTSNVTVTVTGVQFNGSRGDLMQIASLGDTTQTISITNNFFHNAQATTLDGGAGVAITGSLDGANITYNIDNNSFKGTRGASIYSMFNGNSGTINGIVNDNDFGTANGINDVQANNQANYGSLLGGAFFGGIDSKFPGAGSLTYALRISNNTIRDPGRDGVIMLRSATQDKQGTGRLEATITNNTIAEVGTDVAGGIYVQVAGSGATINNEVVDSGKIGLNISNNNINLTAASFADGVYIDNGSSLYGVAYFPGLASATTSNSTFTNYLTGKGNTFVGGNQSGAGGGALNGTASPGNFVLPVPAMAADPNPGLGWQDLIQTMPAPAVDNDEPAPAAPGDPSGGGDTGTGDSPTGTASSGGGSTGSGSGGSTPTVVNANVLTLAELDLLVDAAIARWIEAGATPAQVEAMRSVQFGIVDMVGIYVGSSTHGVINIDEDGAGYGWFVDSTPGDDSEFAGSGTSLHAPAGTAAAGKLDLLTVLMHELGHQIGLDDDYMTSNKDDLMFGYMNVGERRLPADGEAAGAVPGSVGATAFALTPVSVGTLPSNKTVDVFFQATIDQQFDKFISPLMNSATISGSNFANVVATENNSLDTLTLGSTVYVDSNNNGLFDAGEGRTGVALELYADTNDSGGWDAGDLLLGSTASGALGAYSFAGLAPGDYIVVVTAANFGSGAALEGLLAVPGVAADPDNNVDNDNNGAAATGGAIASQTITLSYNDEPDGDPHVDGDNNADTNNTLDFGFVANQPPVANDDAVSVAEDSGANDLSSQLLGNDTDPDGDTRTIASATQGANGTTSVVGGVLTYTPNGNYVGADSFTYTINDGKGNTDTATVTVTVTAVNDAPVNSVPATTQTFNEDGTLTFNAANSNLITVSDGDSGASDVQTTLAVQTGTLTLNAAALAALTSVTGDGTNNVVLTGTAAEINAALNGLVYNPGANYNGDRTLTVTTNDLGNTGSDPGLTGSQTSEQDQDGIAIHVNASNDAPVVVGDGTEEADPIVEDTPGPGETVSSLFSGQYSDSADAQFSAGNPGGSSSGSFTGVAVVANGSSAGTGQWQYYNSDSSTWVDIGARSTASALLVGSATLVRFNPTLDFTGAAPTLTVHLIDNSLGFGITFGQTANISGAGATGGSTPYSAGTVVLSQTVTLGNQAPTVDLDGDDSNAAGTGFASTYTEGGAAAAISDTDVVIADGDAGDDIVSATITITDPETGDKLTVNLAALPAAVTVDAASTDTVVKLVAAAGTSAADFQTAIEAVTYSNTGDNPTDGGTNTARTITVTVNDGSSESVAATATVTVADDNADAPTAATSTITAVEDSHRLIKLADLGFNDVDGSFASITITAVSGGGIYVDSDGSAGPGGWVAATVPATYSAQDLVDGKVSYKADADANGNGIGQIGFTVTDDDGNVSAGSYNLDVNVTAANDSPVLTTGGPIAATEQTAVAILPAGSVSDVDLDALNNGAGNYAGATFSVNRNPATNPTEDVFSLVAGPNFTIDGSSLKTTGGQIFGTISVNGSAGLIVINFTSQQAIATSALVDEVIQGIRYTNTSNNPPASVDLAVGFEDGSPGGGQGAGATDLDVNLVTVNIAGVNDAPVHSLGGTIGTGEDAVDAWLSGMSISDPDADPATDEMRVTFQVASGSLEILTNVAGGIDAGDIVNQTASSITVLATLNKINETLAANNGLTYTPNPNFNGNDTLTVTTNDQGANGTDPGLTGNLTSEEGIATRTISVSASNDAPVAQPDAVSTPEDTVGTGDLTANNGSGADSDVDGDAITISAVNGMAVVGTEITLTSGAKLTVNSNGTYSYNPNGAFNWLTDNTSGAVNTSATDTFNYTVTGGNTVTVTVTVNGVAGAGDRLMGNGADNTITGTPQVDLFLLQQGGKDTVYGLASDDVFYFGASFTGDDTVDGGSGGKDVVVLQGNYNMTLSATNITGIESLSLKSGAFTFYGDNSNAFYDYDITTADENVVAGGQLIVNGGSLRAGEDFTFDGSAETDGKFLVFGGHGVDDLTGGAGNDIFVFEGSRWGSSDSVKGGAGRDAVVITAGNGTTHIEFGATSLTGIESLTVSNQYSSNPAATPDYEFVLHDGNVAAGQTLIVNGSSLADPDQTFVVDGSAEQDGKLVMFGGAGNDVLIGGDGNDILSGGARGDTLTGGDGNDVFRYDNVTDSNSTERDGIQDFNLGDLIDLSRIDANTNLAGDQAFNFIGNAAFSNQAGQLRYENMSQGGPVWLVQGDTDGNGISDFEVVLIINPPDPITVGDFIL